VGAEARDRHDRHSSRKCKRGAHLRGDGPRNGPTSNSTNVTRLRPDKHQEVGALLAPCRRRETLPVGQPSVSQVTVYVARPSLAKPGAGSNLRSQ
jgi:hypothetical protein